MISWSAEPSAALGIVVATTAYLLLASRFRERLGGPERLDRRRLVLFSLAMLVLAVALVSPLDRVADEELFSVHTVQHLLLTLVIPPLLLSGLPGWMLRPLLRLPRVLSIGQALTRPLTAYFLFNLTFAASHFPQVFNPVQAYLALHAVEHLIYMATATVMWWLVLSPLPEIPRLSYPAQLLYLFLQTLGGVAVGALVTLSGSPLYDKYATSTGTWGLTRLEDQQLGGLIMWVGGGLYFFGALAVVFFVWASRDAAEQAKEALAAQRPRTPAAS